MAEKKPEVTKGPGGKEVKLPKGIKHVQVLRGIILKVIDEMILEKENVSGQDLKFVYHEHLIEKLADLGEDNPKSKINQLISHGYLVIRSQEPEPVSYYVFNSKTQGQKFKKNKTAK